MEKPKYDLAKAEPIKKSTVTVGYIFPVADDIWAPLNLDGELLGPPSYRADATNVVLRSETNVASSNVD